MQSDVNGLPGRLGVVGVEIQERIKRRGWIGVQQRLPQARLTDFANGQVLPLVSGVTESSFPVPSLEVVAKFPHLTAQTDVEKLVPVSEFFVPRTSVVNAAKPNASSHRDGHSVNSQSGISNCEGIKRIRDWHADTGRTKERVSPRRFEWIRRKRHSRQRGIEKRARIFEVGKHHQVFVAYVARERAVVHLTVSRR